MMWPEGKLGLLLAVAARLVEERYINEEEQEEREKFSSSLLACYKVKIIRLK